VGISAGAYLASGKPLMLIQSTGLGNSLNALASAHKAYGLPLPIIATWRGHRNDPFPGQVPFGKAIPGILNALEIPYAVIENPAQIPEVGKAIHEAFLHKHALCDPDLPEVWDANEDKAPTHPRSRPGSDPC
jgi:sulfopyruvate decarboxylase subunit beta